MRLRIKQRLISNLDSYDIFNESGETVFTVKSKFANGHYLRIYNAAGQELGSVRERMLTCRP